MIAHEYYRLDIQLQSPVITSFVFDTLLQVKLFMKHLLSNNSLVFYLYKVTVNWNMDTGAISQTSTKVVLDD